MITEETSQRLKGKRVLVAGANGFIGKHLCRGLVGTGAVVCAASRSAQPADLTGVDWRQADMKAQSAALKVVEEFKPDIIYQLCGQVDASRDIKLVMPTLENDILTTTHLLLAAAGHPISRFVMTASLEEPEPGDPPTSPYAAAKMASNAYARMFHALYQVPIVILRPYMSYGPGQNERKVIPYLIRNLLKGEAPKLNSGERMVDWIYIGDVIEAFLCAAVMDSIGGATFDLGSGKLVSIREVAAIIADLAGSKARAVFGSQDRPLERIRVAELSHARERLGWQPATSLEDGLGRTIEWCRKHPPAAS